MKNPGIAELLPAQINNRRGARLCHNQHSTMISGATLWGTEGIIIRKAEVRTEFQAG
jgi:hypothetical protein